MEMQPGKFVAKWFSTIAFVILFTTQAWVTWRLFDQNQTLKEVVIQQDVDNCLAQAEARTTIREIFLGILDQFDDSLELRQIRSFIEGGYPPIICSEGE